MIPVHVKFPNTEAPEASHYIVAKNGLFLSKNQWWVNAVVPVGKVAVLEEQEVTAQLLMPNLPAKILAEVLKTAKKIYDLYGTEVCFLLHYHAETGYQLTVPRQIVSSGDVEFYDSRERLPDHLCVGTIHSHGRYSAFHSDTDQKDEEHMDGVHITVGDIFNYPEFSLSAQMVVSGTRFPIDNTWFEQLVVGEQFSVLNYPEINQWEVPEEWLTKVEMQQAVRRR